MPMHTDVKVQKNKQQMKHNCTYIMYILCVLLFLVLYRHVSSVLSLLITYYSVSESKSCELSGCEWHAMSLYHLFSSHAKICLIKTTAISVMLVNVIQNGYWSGPLPSTISGLVLP